MFDGKKTLPLSIVIPAKNEAQYLPRLLQSIEEQTVQPTEILVADAQSTDSTVTIAKKHPLVRIVKGGTPALGRNNGAKEAKTGIIYFIDADCELPQSDYLAQTYNTFVDQNLDLASAFLSLDAESNKGISRPVMFLTWRTLQRISNLLRHPFVGSLALVIVRKEAFERLGGLSNAYFEDLDIYSRAKKMGLKFRYIWPAIATSGRRFDTPTKTARTAIALGLGGMVFALGLYHRRSIMHWVEKLYGQLGGPTLSPPK